MDTLSRHARSMLMVAATLVVLAGGCAQTSASGGRLSPSDLDVASLYDGEPADMTTVYISEGGYPVYPSTAAGQQQGGYCVAVFDILEDGTTTDVRAVCTSRVFVSSAITSASSLVYRSTVEGASPAMTNARYNIAFQMAPY